ncbi:MAG TPA: ergothioneine biosynthesis protein EgtB [Gammaproteobacteria bacterium]|nr:ergothioneine biosynthesis protein EgtB [Gammaproteobacteria bacterium]
MATPVNDVDLVATRYEAIRAQSIALARRLSAEDSCVQSMDDASPSKWHLAHTSWFFETFVLEVHNSNYSPFDPNYRVLFNSYYNSIGEQYSRPHRGLLTRPSLEEIYSYRDHVDYHMSLFFDQKPDRELWDTIEIGLHHEQQHQELLLMDIKHLFSCNPLSPEYVAPIARSNQAAKTLTFYDFPGGNVQVGADRGAFSFDNERPRHPQILQEYALASRPITNLEFLEFIQDGAYNNPLLWLADGWATIRKFSWEAPMYWRKIENKWFEFTLTGLHELVLHAPVVHVSYYEADAYARWANARLPTEAEWESAAGNSSMTGNFVENLYLQPQPIDDKNLQLSQLFGDVWEWTMSPYTPYPGYQAPMGAIGEYNGKFMSGQIVLRGGCCVTPADHIRKTYRNFFYPANRWQFGGIRLAR